MENECQSEEVSSGASRMLFGEEFAYVAIAVTAAWTYGLINAISYVA